MLEHTIEASRPSSVELHGASIFQQTYKGFWSIASCRLVNAECYSLRPDGKLGAIPGKDTIPSTCCHRAPFYIFYRLECVSDSKNDSPLSVARYGCHQHPLLYCCGTLPSRHNEDDLPLAWSS